MDHAQFLELNLNQWSYFRKLKIECQNKIKQKGIVL